MSLRARLLVVLALVSAVGLLAADIATYAALRSSLFDRVDSSLDSSATGVSSSLATQGFRPGPGPSSPRRQIQFLAQFGVLTAGMYVEIRPGDGSEGLQGTLTRPGETAPPPPRVPKGFGPTADGGARRATVSAEKGGTRFRLLARTSPFADSTLILGVPLKDPDETLDQLRLIMLLVAGAVIASTVLLGLWLIRRACGRSGASRRRPRRSAPATSRGASSPTEVRPRSGAWAVR